jgi:hypothetical protein
LPGDRREIETASRPGDRREIETASRPGGRSDIARRRGSQSTTIGAVHRSGH